MCTVNLHAAEAGFLCDRSALTEALGDILDFDISERSRRIEKSREILAEGDRGG